MVMSNRYTLLKRCYNCTTVATDRKCLSLLWPLLARWACWHHSSVATVAPSSYERADIIHLLLLGTKVATGKLILAHPLLLDRNLHLVYSLKHILHLVSKKHNLHLVSERKHNLITYIYTHTKFMHIIQFASSSTKSKQFASRSSRRYSAWPPP
jgi:hypothetical protein